MKALRSFETTAFAPIYNGLTSSKTWIFSSAARITSNVASNRTFLGVISCVTKQVFFWEQEVMSNGTMICNDRLQSKRSWSILSTISAFAWETVKNSMVVCFISSCAITELEFGGPELPKGSTSISHSAVTFTVTFLFAPFFSCVAWLIQWSECRHWPTYWGETWT